METNQNSNKFEWAVEFGRTLIEKVPNENAGKIVLFAAYAGALVVGLSVGLEKVLKIMGNPQMVKIQ